MHDIVTLPWLFLLVCLYVPNTVAAPAGSRLTSMQARSINDTPISLSSIDTSLQDPQDRNHASDDLQPIPYASFPTYGVVLLVLFIIICAMSSAFVLILFYSNTARAWTGRASGRVYTLFTGTYQGGEARKDQQASYDEEGREKGREAVLDISSVNSDPSVYPCNASPKLKDKRIATSSQETMSTINPPAPFSVSSPSPSSHKRSSTGAVQFPQISPHPRPPSLPSSPLLDRLQTLLSTSKMMLRNLTADLTLQPSTHWHPHSPNVGSAEFPACATVEPNALSPTSSPITRTDSDIVITTEITDDRGSLEMIPVPTVPLTLSTLQSPPSQSDHSMTHSSPSINSRSGFYSLSGDAQLSASTAFHSFIDLPSLLNPCDTHSSTIPISSIPPDDAEPTVSVLSPRYVHGVQLETIHEESDGHISALSSASFRDDSPTNFPCTSCSDHCETNLSNAGHNAPTSVRRVTLSKADTAKSTFTEEIPSTWTELAHGPHSSSVRFSSVARPAPPPSEPSSGHSLPAVSALRSPERSDRRHSVAWLQPVIDWAVDHPQDDSERDLEDAGLDNLDNIPDMENDAECAAALHAADAMAAVMDSLAAIGLDPTDMGLMTGETISSSLSNSGFHSISPSLPFADSVTFRASLHAQAAAADIIEEEEVEQEIGAPRTGYNIPSPQQLRSVVSLDDENRTQSRDNGRLYDGQEQGENIKTALLSLLSPSLSHVNLDKIRVEGSAVRPVVPVAHSGLVDKTASSAQNNNVSPKEPGKLQIRCSSSKDVNGDSRIPTPRARSPSIIRTPRTVQPDRVYASPSSLAGLSPFEVAKKFSSSSVSSAGSTPSPRVARATSPQHRASPVTVSPLQLRKAKCTADAPTFNCTASTLTSSPRYDPVTPSPRSRTPLSIFQQDTAASIPSPLGSAQSTPMISPRRSTSFLPQFSSSPISPLQRPKPAAVSSLRASPTILIERTNSVEFDPM